MTDDDRVLMTEAIQDWIDSAMGGEPLKIIELNSRESRGSFDSRTDGLDRSVKKNLSGHII